MSRKNDKALNGSAVGAAEQQQPSVESSFLDELLNPGTAVLRAKTFGELKAKIDDIPAECRYAVGAIARSKEDGGLSLRIDILKH